MRCIKCGGWKTITCEKCGGKGFEEAYTIDKRWCKHCGGTGEVICPSCGGTGTNNPQLV